MSSSVTNPGFEISKDDSDGEYLERGERTNSSIDSRRKKKKEKKEYLEESNFVPTRRAGQLTKQVMPLPPKSPSYRNDRVTVYIRVVFCKLGEIDTVKECFTADVFLQARWRDAALDGVPDDKTSAIDWTKYWTPKLYIDNSVTEIKDNTWRLVVHNDENEAYVYERRRVKAVFLENMELNEFPFDTQDITVKILSERNVNELELEEDSYDVSSINIQNFVDEQEWKLYLYIETSQEVVDKVMEGSNEKHPGISYRCRASRRFGFYIWNIFVVMFLICSMTFATFSVDYKVTQNRLQLTFILLLTTVTFKFTVNQSLPRISYLTYLDYYIMSSMIMLITICIWHAIVFSVLGTNADIINIDKYVLAGLASLYIIGHLTFILFVYCGVLHRRRSLSKKEKNHATKIRNFEQGVTNTAFAITMKAFDSNPVTLTNFSDK